METTQDLMLRTLIKSMMANAKLDALVASSLDDNQKEVYNVKLKAFWRNDLIQLYEEKPYLFSDDALDALISFFD